MPRRHVAVVVVIAGGAIHRLDLGVAHHQGLDHLAQRVLRQRQVGGEEAGQPCEHQGLHREPLVALGGIGLLAVAQAAAKRVGEQRVEILVEIGRLPRPGFPELGQELGAAESTVQLSISVFLIGLVLGQLVIGPISDRLGRRGLLLAGTTSFAVLSVAVALAPSMPLLIAGRFLQGCAGAGGLVLARAVLTDRFAGPRLPFYFSIQSMIGPACRSTNSSSPGFRMLSPKFSTFKCRAARSAATVSASPSGHGRTSS